MGRFAKAAAAGAAMLLVMLAGCAGRGQDRKPVDDPVARGWEIAAEAGSSISDDERELFEEATEGLTDLDYEPVAVIATQLVSGTNRAYLCTGTVVSPGGGVGWHVMGIYEDLGGGVRLLDIKELDITQPVLSEDPADAETVGAWTVAKPGSDVLSAEVAELFEKAMAGVEGVDFKPIALLGTQIVSDTNYLVLCYGEPVAPDTRGALYLVQIHADLDGGAEVANVGLLDLLAYV